MKTVVDANGLSCPEPVLRLKKVIENADEIELLVDSQVCVENCGRFAKSRGYSVAVSGGNRKYIMTLRRE